jgi:hypothetical protein
MKLPLNGLLIASAVGLSTVLAGVSVTGAVSAPKVQAFDTLEVQRINLREKDGTLRMVLSNRAEFPGIIWRNQDHPHPNRSNAAGMLFFNDEGTENGGLIYGAAKGPDGKVQGFGHLSFDQYENDQVLALEQSESDGHRQAGLTIMDRPDASMNVPELMRVMKLPEGPEKTAAMKGLESQGFGGASRLFIGKQEGTVALSLKDATSKTRLRVRVTPQGETAIEFVDAEGKVARAITPTAG